MKYTVSRRLVVFAVALALAFGGAYLLGRALPGDDRPPADHQHGYGPLSFSVPDTVRDNVSEVMHT